MDWKKPYPPRLYKIQKILKYHLCWSGLLNLNSSPFPTPKQLLFKPLLFQPPLCCSLSAPTFTFLHFIQARSNSPMNNGWMDGRLSSIKVLFLCIFLLDGCSPNAGQHALEMSPGTSHSVCLLPEGSCFSVSTSFCSRLVTDSPIQTIQYGFPLSASSLFFRPKSSHQTSNQRALAVLLHLHLHPITCHLLLHSLAPFD